MGPMVRFHSPLRTTVINRLELSEHSVTLFGVHYFACDEGNPFPFPSATDHLAGACRKKG